MCGWVIVRVSVLQGCTWEFASMVGYIKRTYPHTQLIVVGFSLGGNIVCKFLGENRKNQERVLCCVSVCQGYSALRLVFILSSVNLMHRLFITPGLNYEIRILRVNYEFLLNG